MARSPKYEHDSATILEELAPAKDLLVRALAKVQLYVEQGIIGKDLLLVYVGFVLVRRGSQFERLVLFTQVVSILFSGCVKGSVMTVWRSAAAHEEMVLSDRAEETWKDKAQRATVVLRSLDKGDLVIAVFHMLLMPAAGVLAVSEGSAQRLVVSGFLAEVLADRTMVVLDLLGCKHPRLRTRLAVYAAVLVLATLSAPLALLLNALVCGAHLVSRHGLRLAEAAGFVEDPEVISIFSLLVVLVLVPLGAVSQLWAWAFGSGVALHQQLLYLPAALVESCLEAF